MQNIQNKFVKFFLVRLQDGKRASTLLRNYDDMRPST